MGHPGLGSALWSERDAGRGSAGGPWPLWGCPDAALCCCPGELLADGRAICSSVTNNVSVL